MGSAGVLIEPNATVVFGSPDGPRALLHDVRGVTATHLLPVKLEFGVAGLVSLRAPVTKG
jgi:hypothetical protein